MSELYIRRSVKGSYDSGEMNRLSLFLCYSDIFLTNKICNIFNKMSTFTFLAFIYNKGTKVFEIKPNFLTQKKCTWLTPSAFLFLCLFIIVILALLSALLLALLALVFHLHLLVSSRLYRSHQNHMSVLCRRLFRKPAFLMRNLCLACRCCFL